MKIWRIESRYKLTTYGLSVVVFISVVLACVVIAILVGGCDEPKYQTSRETLDDVRCEVGDERHIYCAACCNKALPGYIYCERCLKRWVEGTNGR